MTKVIVEMTMSLDGYMAGPNVSMKHAMGEGGDRLHEWIFAAKTEDDGKILDEMSETTGAVIIGKTMFNVGLQHWGDTPLPFPTFVVTHESLEKRAMKSGTFTFVTYGIESALTQAIAVAGSKNVLIMGGANVAQQYLKAGLVDELRIHIAPILLCNGLRLFDNIGTDHIELEKNALSSTPGVIHIKYRIRK
jgi:dihydrofolate reductase